MQNPPRSPLPCTSHPTPHWAPPLPLAATPSHTCTCQPFAQRPQALSAQLGDKTLLQMRCQELEAALDASTADAVRQQSHAAMMSKTIEALEARLEQQRQEVQVREAEAWGSMGAWAAPGEGGGAESMRGDE